VTADDDADVEGADDDDDVVCLSTLSIVSSTESLPLAAEPHGDCACAARADGRRVDGLMVD